MSVPKSFKTEKGTELPLLNLRGKPYLMVAYRLIWLTEKYEHYTIDTEYLALTDDYSVCRAKVTIFNEDGTVMKSAVGTKREDKKHFADFTEKSESSAIGRALAMLGIGTQFCTQDIDEGERLADSPLPPAKKKRVSSFTRKKKVEEPIETKEKVEESSDDDGWS